MHVCLSHVLHGVYLKRCAFEVDGWALLLVAQDAVACVEWTLKPAEFGR